MFKIFLTKEAAKFYQKSDEKTKNRLDKCFEKLKINPNDGTNIKRLHGELSGLYRYRIGQLRVIYRIEEQRKVIVIAIGSRGNVYKKN